MLEYLKLNIGSYFGGNVDVTVTIKDNIVTANVESILHPDYPREHSLSKKASNEWLSKLDTLKIGSWRSRYEDDIDITDGEGWSIDYKQVGKRCRHISGYMAYPSCWAEFLDVMALVSPVHTLNRFDRVELYYHNIDEIDISESVNLPFNQVKLETTDSIVIDRKSQKITLYDTLGTGCKITREYYVEDGVPELLDECEEWFGELENVNTSSDELPQYELKIINHRGEVVCANGGFNRRELPDCYGEFAERIAEFISFYGMYGSLLNPNNYNKGRKGEEYIFCSVSFSKGGKTYYYRTEDESISIGDRVIVPVGADDAEKTVTVENIEYFTEDDLPMPLNRVKMIMGKKSDMTINSSRCRIDKLLAEIDDIWCAVDDARLKGENPAYHKRLDELFEILNQLNQTDLTNLVKGFNEKQIEQLEPVLEELSEENEQLKDIVYPKDKETKNYDSLHKYIDILKKDDKQQFYRGFVTDINKCADFKYNETLRKYGIEFSFESMVKADIDNANTELLLALLTAVYRADHWCNGIIEKYVDCGFVLKCLQKLFD